MQRYRKQQGFSLMETIIYIALFISLSVLLVDSMLVLMHAYKEARVNRDLLDSSQVATERMVRTIRSASSIAVGSVFATSPGTLVLSVPDGSGGTDTDQFTVVNGAVQLTENGVVSGLLTGPMVAVTNLTFRQITTTFGKAVRIEMTMQSLRNPNDPPILITNTAVLRQSY